MKIETSRTWSSRRSIRAEFLAHPGGTGRDGSHSPLLSRCRGLRYTIPEVTVDLISTDSRRLKIADLLVVTYHNHLPRLVGQTTIHQPNTLATLRYLRLGGDTRKIVTEPRQASLALVIATRDYPDTRQAKLRRQEW